MSSPFMQLYIGDYLRDTSGLTTEAHGAYLLIMFAMWNADGWVSAEPRKMAMFARMTPARWAKIAPDIMPYFTVEDGMATQGRLLKQLEKASGKSLKRSVAGKLGAQAKALKSQQPSQAIATANADANADGLLKHLPDTRNQIPEREVSPQPPASVIPFSTLEMPDIPKSLDRRTPALRKPKGEPDGFPEFYAAYPLHKARPAAAKAYAAALKRASAADLLVAARHYADQRQSEDPKFTKHPATWLNQDCWLDEEPQHVQRTKPNGHNSFLAASKSILEDLFHGDGPGEGSNDCDELVAPGRPLLSA